jgi:hypothetical protein
MSFLENLDYLKFRTDLIKRAQEYLKLQKISNDKNIELEKEIFAEYDLFYYIQVIIKLLKMKPDYKFMDEILMQGANINYLNEDGENALFKVIYRA